jgi:hypothetical protein
MKRLRCSQREWRRRMGELAVAVAVGSAAAVCLVAVIVMYGLSDRWFAATCAFLVIAWLSFLGDLDRDLDPSEPRPPARCDWCRDRVAQMEGPQVWQAGAHHRTQACLPCAMTLGARRTSSNAVVF